MTAISPDEAQALAAMYAAGWRDLDDLPDEVRAQVLEVGDSNAYTMRSDGTLEVRSTSTGEMRDGTGRDIPISPVAHTGTSRAPATPATSTRAAGAKENPAMFDYVGPRPVLKWGGGDDAIRAKLDTLYEARNDLKRSLELHAGQELRASEQREVNRQTEELISVEADIAEGTDRLRQSAQADAMRAYYAAGAAPRGDERFAALARGELRGIDVHPETRGLTIGTGTAGGDTVPTSFYGRLIAHMVEASAVRGAASVLTTDGGEDLQVPTTTANSTASIVDEAATIGDSDPTFGQVTLGAYKYAFLIAVTNELLADSGVDLESYLAKQGGQALGRALGAHLVDGTGSGQPKGVITAATTGVTGAGTTPTADELIGLFFSVIGPYRANGSWLMNDSTWAAIRKLKDSNNDYLVGSLAGGAEPTLLGRPVLLDPSVADTGAGAKSVAFGDLSTYYVRQAGPVRIERNDAALWNSDQVSFRFIMRADGNQVDTTGAIKVFTGKAS